MRFFFPQKTQPKITGKEKEQQRFAKSRQTSRADLAIPRKLNAKGSDGKP